MKSWRKTFLSPGIPSLFHHLSYISISIKEAQLSCCRVLRPNDMADVSCNAAVNIAMHGWQASHWLAMSMVWLTSPCNHPDCVPRSKSTHSKHSFHPPPLLSPAMTRMFPTQNLSHLLSSDFASLCENWCLSAYTFIGLPFFVWDIQMQCSKQLHYHHHSNLIFVKMMTEINDEYLLKMLCILTLHSSHNVELQYFLWSIVGNMLSPHPRFTLMYTQLEGGIEYLPLNGGG